MDKVILSKFLKAGFMENGKTYPTHLGTAQGGIISATLVVMALSGLERKLISPKERQRYKEKINVISYADDFVVTASSEQILREKVMPILTKALQEVGLELSSEKTKITPVHRGFDLLGFNIRKYENEKLLIKPSKASIRRFLKEIKTFIKSSTALPTETLIYQLNYKIVGWSNYYRSVVSSKVFATIDDEIFKALQRWSLKRHPNKGKRWIVRKYYTSLNGNQWRFYCKVKDEEGCNNKLLYLKHAQDSHIRRHKKILAKANPFDPNFKEYFEQRNKERKACAYAGKATNSTGLKYIQPYAGLSGVR